jgi:hypothetical protein
MVRAFRAKDKTTPVVLMGYANPVERYDQSMAPAPSCAMRPPPASTACWWTTRPRNAPSSPPRSRPPAWT